MMIVLKPHLILYVQSQKQFPLIIKVSITRRNTWDIKYQRTNEIVCEFSKHLVGVKSADCWNDFRPGTYEEHSDVWKHLYRLIFVICVCCSCLWERFDTLPPTSLLFFKVCVKDDKCYGLFHKFTNSIQGVI